MGTLARYLGYASVVAALLTVASFLRVGEPSTPLFAVTFVLMASTFLARSAVKKREGTGDGGPISDGERPSKPEKRPEDRTENSPGNSKDSDSSDGGGFSGGGFDGGGGK